MRSFSTLVFLAALATGACARAPAAPPSSTLPVAKGTAAAATVEPTPKAWPEGSALLESRGLHGTCVVLQLDDHRMLATDAAMAGQGYLPASTFKIPNTLIGLETGVISGERFSLRWDGVNRPIEAWNRDHDLASAMKYSVVWFYQEVARRIGEARMKEWVERLHYGNRSIEGGIDEFWLDGGLRITPLEQVDFMRRMHDRTLPVRREHMDLVDRITTLESGDGWAWRGKTGTQYDDESAHGWLVGTTSHENREWAYALLVVGQAADVDTIKAKRMGLARELLELAGALPAGR